MYVLRLASLDVPRILRSSPNELHGNRTLRYLHSHSFSQCRESQRDPKVIEVLLRARPIKCGADGLSGRKLAKVVDSYQDYPKIISNESGYSTAH